MDIERPHFPTGVMEIKRLDDTNKIHATCLIRMVGVGHIVEVVVKVMATDGVLWDTGANSCMANLELHFIQLHDIVPGAVSVVLNSG